MDNKLKLFIFRKSELIRQNKTHLKKFLNNQYGGSKKLKITFNDHKYIFDETMDENYYVLYSKDEIECNTVLIDIENKIAEIHGIGNYKSCLDDINTNVGSPLLKITLKMIKKYKDKLNIEKILITDNSLKNCENKNIKLSVMLTLLTGVTWYGKYGFTPVDERLKIKYENNKKIINHVALKDIDLLKYLKMAKLDNTIIDHSKKFIKNNQSLLVKDYLTKFLKKYDNTCKYFYLFYEQLFDDLNLTSFYRNTFELVL